MLEMKIPFTGSGAGEAVVAVTRANSHLFITQMKVPVLMRTCTGCTQCPPGNEVDVPQTESKIEPTP